MAAENNLLCCNKVHFIGAGGVSVNALAKYAALSGKTVSASDKRLTEEAEELKKFGVKIFLGHHAVSVREKDLVVYTSAADSDNPELKEAARLGIKAVCRAEYLGAITAGFKTSIAVAGCHGKTTATAMIADISIAAGSDPTVFLGGYSYDYGNFRNGGKNVVIAEACEYKKSFLKIAHNVSVVLNVDNDHKDSYESDKDLEESFLRFAGDTLAVVNADDARCADVFNKTTVTFGVKNAANYEARRIARNKCGGYSFTLYAYGEKACRINLNVTGRYNVFNALAAAAVAAELGVKFGVIKTALENFKGVKRRNENIGVIGRAECVADYAHHPTEIKAAVAALGGKSENTLVVFQPHTYSRTENLLSEFVNVLLPIKNLVILKTYAARENYSAKGSAKTLAAELVKAGSDAIYVDNDAELYAAVKDKAVKTDKILFIGAGDVYEKAKTLVKNFNKTG